MGSIGIWIVTAACGLTYLGTLIDRGKSFVRDWERPTKTGRARKDRA